MKLIVLSDIHANMTAFMAVLAHVNNTYGSNCKFAHLGDTVDYGMRPNESLEMLCQLENRLIINLAGNHELALFGDGLEKFGSKRGLQANLYTKSVLLPSWLSYIESQMSHGEVVLEEGGKKILFIHGDLSDSTWGKMGSDEMSQDKYRLYDYVFSGHTHIPKLNECFYKDQDSDRRGLKKTTFVNPGSVGQPRNHNPFSQYVCIELNTGVCHFNSVEYDCQKELSLFNGEVNSFYGTRLKLGI